MHTINEPICSTALVSNVEIRDGAKRRGDAVDRSDLLVDKRAALDARDLRLRNAGPRANLDLAQSQVFANRAKHAAYMSTVHPYGS